MQQKAVYDPSVFLKADEITVSEETQELLRQAQEVYSQHFDGKTWYGRCIFISWYCSLADCTFCFRSTNQHKERHPETSRRGMGSMLLEALFCKVFNWRIEFVTGGYGIMPFPDIVEIVKNVSAVYGEKIWLNLGVIAPAHLEELRPYVKGLYSSLETVTPRLHDYVCPSKPILPYEMMFKKADGFKKSIAIIVGLGDTLEEMKHLFDFVKKHQLDRVTMYALKPVRGTEYTHGPSVEEYVQWIARLRVRFPKLEIVAGTNLRRCEEVGYLMKAGANAITKFPATKQFATKKAKIITGQILQEKREFVSNITTLPRIDWEEEISSLPIKEEYKKEMLEKLPAYVKKFENPVDKDPQLKVDQSSLPK
jgi:biotin synthase-like enzyme